MANQTLKTWKPHTNFHIKNTEYNIVVEFIQSHLPHTEHCIYKYYKEYERNLLKSFRNYINTCINRCPSKEWIANAKFQWRRLALIRDYYDHICCRDESHYIRTDDCRRFINCVIKGLKTKKLSNPVVRILSGKTAPRYFKHPLFVKFNKRHRN